VKTFARTKTGRVSFFAAITIVALLLYGCVTRKPEPASTPQTYNPARPPVEAPAAVKAADFRLSPPVVEDFTVKKLTASTELVAVRFAADRRLGQTVTINPGESPVVLHDDGLNGDEKAGDQVYSAVVPSDWDSLAAEQDRLLAELNRKKAPLTVPVFRGREVVSTQAINPAELARLRASGIIKLTPFGTGGTLVVPNESLFITDTNVVDDPSRTFNPCTGAGTPMGKWTFGYLMTQMANEPVTGVNPSDFVLNWLQTWLTPQTVNGFAVPARANIQGIINAWPKLADGRLDLARAPMKLSAIVNRIDLAGNSAYGVVGGAEGRFVFTVIGGGGTNAPGTNACFPDSFTVILEYGVPKHTCPEIQNWAQQWLNLQSLTLGSPAYNTALEAITEVFAAANADPAKPNGSALDQLRTDEIQLAFPWELREFQIQTNHQLSEVTVKQTPDEAAYNQGGPQNGDLATWINANAAAIVANTYTVPLSLPFAPFSNFLGGSAPNGIDVWNAPGITEATRHGFSLNTCDDCHGAETRTGFLHVDQRPNPSGEATLSDFLTGNNMPVTVPVAGSPQYTYGDLARRAQILSEDASSSCLTRIRIPVLLATH